ncbi:MAG: PxxKW family cysteine-rich protein [Desulfobacterales bacterium]
MICQTIRKGVDCPFMTAAGCSYNGGKCHVIVEACQGCGRSSEFDTGWFCSSCPEPAAKWKNGNCNLATHVKTATTVDSAKKINPLKASKRGKI